MALYLQMDGVDDYISVPSGITFDEVQMDIVTDSLVASDYFIFAINNLRVSSNGTQSFTFTAVYEDGVQVTSGTNWVDIGKRTLIRLTKTSATTAGVSYIFSQNTTAGFTQGRIYSIKFLNAGVVQVHYDMTTGSVNDISGNGHHATLTGGTWVSDGGTGTDGSTKFDLRNSLYSDSFATSDTKQNLYADLSVQMDTKQAVYSDLATGYDTRFKLYQDNATLFDTLQEFFSDGIVGSTPFDIRMVLYADNSAVYDSKQSWFIDGVFNVDLAQQLYGDNRLDADMKLVIYTDAIVKADMAQRLYTDVTIAFDTLQAILEEWAEYNEVIRVVLNITRKQTSTLDITQRKQSELNL